MFDALEGGNTHETFDDFLGVDHAIGGEHFSKLEAEDGIVRRANLGVEVNDFSIAPIMEAGGLEDDGSAAAFCNFISAAMVEVEEVSLDALDEDSGNERLIRAERFASPVENVIALGFGEVICVTGVHVDRALQAGGLGAADVFLKGFLGDGPISFERKETGGDSFDFPTEGSFGGTGGDTHLRGVVACNKSASDFFAKTMLVD